MQALPPDVPPWRAPQPSRAEKCPNSLVQSIRKNWQEARQRLTEASKEASVSLFLNDRNISLGPKGWLTGQIKKVKGAGESEQ